MSLESGLYVITSKLTNTPIGRFAIEDLSLRPKPVLALPLNITAPPIIVEKSGNGYKIKAGYAPTGAFGNKVHAALIEYGFPVEDWVITAQSQHGPNMYTIERKDQSSGWVVDNHTEFNGHAISVRPLTPAKSQPPRYSDNELFGVARVDRV